MSSRAERNSAGNATLSRNVTTALAALIITLDVIWIYWIQLADWTAWYSIGFVSAQCSLIITWATVSEAITVWRFILGCLSWFIVWNIAQLPFAWPRTESLLWALVFLFQTGMIASAICIYRRFHEALPWRFAFDLRTLIFAVTAVAITLGCLRWAASQHEWELDEFPIYDAIVAGLIVCTFNSLQAFVCLWAFYQETWPKRFTRLLMGMALLCLLPVPADWSIDRLTSYGSELEAWFMIMGVEFLMILIVIGVVNICRDVERRLATAE